MTSDDQAVTALEEILKEVAKGKTGRSVIAGLLHGSFNIVVFKKGDYLTHMGLPVNRILIHLDGSVEVYKVNATGVGIRGGISDAPQIYGLYEAISRISDYGVALRAMETVHCVVVPPKEFLHAINQNHQIALFALQFMAKFTDRMLNRNDQLTLNTPYENLINYLYENSVGLPLPHRITTNKAELAELLNISVRSLYRYLDQLEADQIIQRSHGSLLITKAGFDGIKHRTTLFANPTTP